MHPERVVCGDSVSLPHNSLSILSLVRLGGGLGHAWALPGHLALRPNVDEPSKIAFAQVDTSGELGPSYWSFGQPLPILDAESHEMPPRSFSVSQLSEFTDSDVQVLQEYLDTLAWSPTSA